MSWNIYRHPADPSGPPIEEETENRSEDMRPEPVLDAEAELKTQIASLKAESEQWHDRFLRKAAEFENYRKRTEKEKADSITLAKSSVMLEFLPVLDACERALTSLSSADSGETLDEYKQGVELLYKQVLSTLQRLGVTPIEAEGQDFNPNLHEALIREVTSEHKENTVIEELRRGYLFKDRLLRPAQVKVASNPTGERP
jgi:molecular chaperone GrpE